MPHQYNNETKARIFGRRDAGLSLQKISDLTRIPKTSIQDIVTRFNDRGTVQNLPRPGRKPILNEHDIRQLKRVTQIRRQASLNEIINSITKEVSSRTVQRVLHKEGIFSRIAVIKPHLRPQHFNKQLAVARAHVNWSVEDWKKVIWTDKSSFELLEKPTPTCIWRTQGERYSFDCQVAQHHSGRQSMMVWAGFCDTKQSAIIIMGPNACQTQGFIDNVYLIGLLPFYNHLQQQQQAPQLQAFMLCEDNTPVHTSLLSHQWKESQWPSNSPNCNPIKNAWKKMKVMVHVRFHPKTLPELRIAVQAAWNDMPKDYFRALIQ
ncbi:hypothetical protein O181_131955 [Austropuccinia psidii MF-1]|uniref:Transposase Tc1-like domain-containing protein n=1 Tax=Austropuccinia psidii MF-1 TaxID=1389203 RepID=A0A9Q3L689_9BASI|nr:hypothetical protein [Austropuccinia psidii MF-1]